MKSGKFDRVENLPDLKNQLSSKGLFDAFKLQLTRDFDRSNFPSDFVSSLEPDYQNIHDKIVRELERSEKKADANVMNLLYRVDISEGQLKKYLNENKGENHFNVIAELIIKRVLQKVVIKQHYKNNDSSSETPFNTGITEDDDP